MTKNAAQFYDALKAQGVAARVLLPPGRPRRRAAGLPDQPVVHEVPVGPGQRRREPAEVVGRAPRRAPARRASRRSRRGLEHDHADGREHRAVPRRRHADDPADQRQRDDHDTTRVITNIAGNALTLATAVARPASGRQRRGREPRLRQRQPDAVRRVAGPGDRRRGAQARPRAGRPAAGSRSRPAATAKRDADRRRRRDRGDADERGGRRGLAPALRDEPADAPTCASAARRR